MIKRKSILITGCSSGIGLDSALTLNDCGWRAIPAGEAMVAGREHADCKTWCHHCMGYPLFAHGSLLQERQPDGMGEVTKQYALA